MVYKYSIKELVEEVSKGKDSALLLGTFLDFFYSKETSSKEREKLVEEEPESYSNVSQEYYASIAATVHNICEKYDVPRPEWIMKDKYFLKEPYFGIGAKGNLRLILLLESPAHFRMRNVFVSENALDRV